MDASTLIAESATGTSESERTLIVLLHGFHKAPASLEDLKGLLRSQSAFRDASFFVPALPLTMRSTKDPVAIANGVVCDIDSLWAAADGKIDRIVLIGHSYGALLARMVYVVACGETAQAPFEKTVTDRSARGWAARVERLVLLAVLGLLAYIGFCISQLELGSVPLSALATLAFVAVVWKLVTRI